MLTGTDLIRADHQRVNLLFEEFAAQGNGAAVGQILDALTAHDQAESAALYPLALALLADTVDVDQYELAHSGIKRLMDELRQLEGPPLVAAVEALRAAVTAHVAEEEGELLPALEAVATADQLQGLAARIQQNKQRVG
ncbi:MAG: Hemerythrin cation binding domain protein [Acidimicrobiia bacterium]|nr:Hemerythrin cation binding domain protein [Acidimicrobiia bacterium]